MKRCFALVAMAIGLSSTYADKASAELPQTYAYRQAQYLPWHNGYYDPYWGQPLALVVPPTAEYQSNYGWGVGGTRVAPIYHQFSRPYPGYGAAWGNFQPTPYWPSDTQQFGVYYIRGPW